MRFEGFEAAGEVGQGLFEGGVFEGEFFGGGGCGEGGALLWCWKRFGGGGITRGGGLLGVEEVVGFVDLRELRLRVLMSSRDVRVGVGAAAFLHDVEAFGGAEAVAGGAALAVGVFEGFEGGFGEQLGDVWVVGSCDAAFRALCLGWWFWLGVFSVQG